VCLVTEQSYNNCMNKPKSFELLTNINCYDTEALIISNLAKKYNTTEAVVVRSLLNSNDNNVFEDALGWFKHSNCDEHISPVR